MAVESWCGEHTVPVAYCVSHNGQKWELRMRQNAEVSLAGAAAASDALRWAIRTGKRPPHKIRFAATEYVDLEFLEFIRFEGNLRPVLDTLSVEDLRALVQQGVKRFHGVLDEELQGKQRDMHWGNAVHYACRAVSEARSDSHSVVVQALNSLQLAYCDYDGERGTSYAHEVQAQINDLRTWFGRQVCEPKGETQ